MIGAGESPMSMLVKDHVSAAPQRGRAVSEMRLRWNVDSAVEKIILE